MSFSYSGKKGPEHWGDLKPEFRMAKEGKKQSPIDLTNVEEDDSLLDLSFHYQNSTLALVNNGHSIQCNYEYGSFIRWSGKEYKLEQFHFHTPSEHAKEGKIFAMEGHLVHKDSYGDLLVVGILFEYGQANSFLEKFWKDLPETAGTEYRGIKINVKEMLPEKGGYFAYQGSLTTPPCCEGVKWFIMSNPVSVSPEQVTRFTEIIGQNARPLQPINDRKILEH